MKVFEALARWLAESAETPLFGVVGDANAYLVDDFKHRFGGAYVAAASENGAVLMAMGAAMVSGGTGFATVTHGPALTNCVTALVEAVKSNTPLVLLSGAVKPSDRENLQAIDQRAVILSTGAGYERLYTPASALADLARATRRARAERRPVVLDMPADLLWEATDWQLVSAHVPDLPPGTLTGEALDNAIGIIAAARAPVVLAGRGALGAREALIRLAQRIDAPLATTMRAKSLFAGVDHALGIHGTVSTPAAAEALARCDCLIAFGASLNFHTTAQGAFLRDRRIIQIADRAEDLGRNATADVAILGRAEDVATTFVHWLDEAEIPGSGFTRTLPARGLDTPPPAVARDPGPGAVDFLSTLQQLDRILPAERTLITDAGRWMVRSYGQLTVPGPLDHVTTASFGSIGLGMGAAIGAAATRRDRTAVLVCGDGGFMLGNLTEFHTATREKLDLIVVVFNDGAYGAEHIQFVEKQRDPAIALFDWPDFCTVARAFGAEATRISSPESLAALPGILNARDRTRPFLIDVRLNPDQVAMW